MTIPEGKHCLSVPRDREGAEELERGVEDEEKVLFVTISDEENDSLFGTYKKINKTLGIIIADAEEEYIEADRAMQALEIVREDLATADGETQVSALRKLEQALEAVMEFGTFLELAL